MAVNETNSNDTVQLLSISWDKTQWTLSLSTSFIVGAVVVVAIVAPLLIRLFKSWRLKDFEIDEAEIGVGSQKLKLKPNSADRQVAYSIWVELSTRKIGLPIDLKHDVISEIYDSWYTFFSVTRDLIKSIPVNRVTRDSTQKIIHLSVEVLNEGLRPHLTHWQARYRAWYDRELKRFESEPGREALDPQQIQAQFPQFDTLSKDLLLVNERLIRYRKKMNELVLGK